MKCIYTQIYALYDWKREKWIEFWYIHSERQFLCIKRENNNKIKEIITSFTSERVSDVLQQI